MDCLRTQEILSQAADRAPVETDLLREAKAHCAECPECARFVRGLTRLHNAPKPRMAPHALESLIKRARVEAERIEVAQAQAKAQELMDPAGDAAAEAAALTALADLKAQEATKRPQSSWAKLSALPMRQQAIIGSALAAAIVVVGIVSVAGMSYLLTPTGTQTAALDEMSSDSAVRSTDLGAESDAAEAPLALEEAETALENSFVSASESYIVFDGWVYRAAGARDVDLSELTVAGALNSDLGSGRVKPRSVWSEGNIVEIFVRADNDELLGFDLVTRRFDGAYFGLRSNEIASYGEWPTLPAGIPDPVDDDGSPTFRSAEVDDGGITMFPLSGTTAEQGYAIQPFTDSESATDNNPNWTWWLPVPTE